MRPQNQSNIRNLRRFCKPAIAASDQKEESPRLNEPDRLASITHEPFETVEIDPSFGSCFVKLRDSYGELDFVPGCLSVSQRYGPARYNLKRVKPNGMESRSQASESPADSHSPGHVRGNGKSFCWLFAW